MRSATLATVLLLTIPLMAQDPLPRDLGRADSWRGLLEPRPGREEVVVRLDSGEWLRGRLEFMNYGRFYFNSDKIDRIQFDWDDVAYFRSTETYEFVFRHDLKVRGTGSIDPDTVELQLPDGQTQSYARSELLAIYSGSEGFREARWFGKVTGSYDTVSGNTDEETIDLRIDATRRSGSLEIATNAYTSFSEVEGVENRKKHSLLNQANYDLNDTYYVTIWRVLVEYDKFQNIDRRYQAALGAGVNLIRQTDLNWRVELGPGYERTRFREVAPADDRREDTSGMYFSIRFSWDVGRKLDFVLDTDSFLSFEDADDATHNITTTLSYEVLSDFDIDFTLILDRNDNRERDADGRLPERDDVRFLVGLGWKF